MNTARERAAQLAAESQAAERKAKVITLVGVLVVLGIVAGILTFAFMNRNTSSAGGPTANPNPAAALPAGANPTNFGLPLGKAPSSAPLVQIFEDAQCPACQSFEAAFGSAVNELADSNEVQIVLQPMFFLDNRLPQSKGSSLRAANAIGCAADEGKAKEFHTVLYGNPPIGEGQGYSDDILKALGAAAGISAADRFGKCIDDGKYFEWVANSNEWAFANGIEGTPTIWLNGKQLPDSAFSSQEAFLAAIRSGR